jgi:hypothetical protein
MTKIISLPTIAGALLACSLSAAPAQAGPNRTWVSGKGTDSGPCTVTAPCRTFGFALTQTAAGGEIDVLDPAGYGTVTITKSISIINDGVGVAAIGAGSGNAITINAGASDSVHLRGLTIEGLGVGLSGIRFAMGKSLAIENCVVRNFTQAGINISPSTSSSSSVSNTIVSNNFYGTFIAPTGAAVVKGVLGKVTANNNDNGFFVDGEFMTGASLNVVIADSEASNNNSVGVLANSSSGHVGPLVILRNVVASNNGTGLRTNEFAVLEVANSVVTGNGTGFFQNGAPMFTYGNNIIDGNTSNTGNLTTLPMQ